MRRLLVIGIMSLLIAPVMSTPAFSMFTSKTTATWNLQGAGHRTDSKWHNQVSMMVVGPDAVNILGLQEAGSPPPSAISQGTPAHFSNPDGLGTPVTEYLWPVRSGQYRYVYFSDNDQGAHRVNVAIVTDQVPDEVVILRPTSGSPSARPLLGVRFGNEYYFSIHADANGGNNSTNTILAIHNYVYHSPHGENFFIMGDWNRSPTQLETQVQANAPFLTNRIRITSAHGTATQVSGGNLDYAVLGTTNPGLFPNITAFTAILALLSIRGTIVSDHTPVRFNPP